MKKLEFKTFSIKKLLITILYTIIISVFIGTTALFLLSIPEVIQLEVINSLDGDSETLIEIGKVYQEQVDQINKKINEEKELYGEDYPADEILLYQFICKFSTSRIIQVYLFSLITGVILGIVIYIVAIQNIPPKQVFIELVIAFIILVMLIALFNIGYEMFLNKSINNIGSTDIKYSTDLDISNIVILYIIIAIVIYIIHMIKQKVLTNKLNKQLNTK